MFDSDWDAEAEEELLAIEAAYAAAKRRISVLNGVGRQESSPAQRRRLPGWANAAAPSGSTRRDLCAVDGDLSSEVDVSPCPYPTNGLWSLSPTPCQVNLKLRQQALTFGGRTIYGRTTAEVEQATVEILDKIEQLKHNADEISLGFDIEWKPIFRKGEAPRKAAVLQICMESSSCYVMHIFHSGVPPILKSLLEDSSSSKVGIGIAGDAAKMSREYNVHVASLVDLSRYANLKLGGTPKSWGLGSLTEVLACKQENVAVPNEAAEDGLLRDHGDKVIFAFYKYSGIQNSFMAELIALKYGLKIYFQKNVQRVWIELDSLALYKISSNCYSN